MREGQGVVGGRDTATAHVMSRRGFFRASTAGVLGASAAGAVMLGGRALGAQLPPGEGAASAADGASGTAQPSAASNMNMNEGAYRAVGAPPKPGARPQLTADERDALEHQIKCQCGCTLDVYTCRTTDFSCGVSPAMHQDVVRLVDGGYARAEIVDAFQRVYGEQVLMAPKKAGFNLAGYAMPFAALGTGTIVVGALLRRWGARAAAVNAAAYAEQVRGDGAQHQVDATDAELAQLEAAVRGGER